jgi:hypothetical protein
MSVRETYTIIGIRNGEQEKPNFLIYGKEGSREEILEEYEDRIESLMKDDPSIGKVSIKTRK